MHAADGSLERLLTLRIEARDGRFVMISTLTDGHVAVSDREDEFDLDVRIEVSKLDLAAPVHLIGPTAWTNWTCTCLSPCR